MTSTPIDPSSCCGLKSSFRNRCLGGGVGGEEGVRGHRGCFKRGLFFVARLVLKYSSNLVRPVCTDTVRNICAPHSSHCFLLFFRYNHCCAPLSSSLYPRSLPMTVRCKLWAGLSETLQQVYARRVPFMALVRDPWAVLEAQLRADSVAKLVPLAGDDRNPHEHACSCWWRWRWGDYWFCCHSAQNHADPLSSMPRYAGERQRILPH